MQHDFCNAKFQPKIDEFLNKDYTPKKAETVKIG